MTLHLLNKVILSLFALLLLNSCFTANENETFYMDTKQIITEVKKASDTITKYATEAELNSLLQCYSDSPDFLAISSDGKCRDFEDFRKVCTEYYQSLARQKVSTKKEIYYVLDNSHVILTWTGNITAYFKNGGSMKMKDYSVSSLFKKIGKNWKVIHSQESSLPPEISKSKSK